MWVCKSGIEMIVSWVIVLGRVATDHQAPAHGIAAVTSQGVCRVSAKGRRPPDATYGTPAVTSQRVCRVSAIGRRPPDACTRHCCGHLAGGVPCVCYRQTTTRRRTRHCCGHLAGGVPCARYRQTTTRLLHTPQLRSSDTVSIPQQHITISRFPPEGSG